MLANKVDISNKNPFPIKDTSPRMRRFVRRAKESGHHFLTVLEVGSNTLELNHLIKKIGEERGGITLPIFKEQMPGLVMGSPDFPPLRSCTQGAVFLRGVSQGMQEVILSGTFQHLRGVIIVLDKHPIAELTPAFLRFCTRKLAWPSWAERPKDHERILHEIHHRIRMPQGREKPDYREDDVMKLLTSTSFEGTDDVEKYFKDAITRYIAAKAEGKLLPEHFMPLSRVEQQKSVLAAAAE